MNLIKSIVEFAEKVEKRISDDGETQEVAEWIHSESERMIKPISERTYRKCQYAGGLLDLKIASYFLLLGFLPRKGECSLSSEYVPEHWLEINEIISELIGKTPIRTFEREREKWIER